MNIPYNLNPNVATYLAKICCSSNSLPQGAPTSPIVSNMICSRMDSQVLRLAQKYRCTYTRYADDLTFSTSINKFPTALVTKNSLGQLEVGEELERIVENNGFKVNPNKVRLRNKYQRQEVTGIIINEFPNVKRKYIRQIRAMLHAWETHGPDAAEQEFQNIYDKKHRSEWKKPPSFKQVVKGKIQYLGMVRGKNDPLYLYYCKLINKLEPGSIQIPSDDLDLLLESFINLENELPQRRGYILESMLKEVFAQFNIPLFDPFRRNSGAEQIDGAFKFDGWVYLVECKWRQKLSDMAELDSLNGKISRSGKQTMGLFLSINGWSENVPDLLKISPDKSIVLMNGNDLRKVLEKLVDLNELISRKVYKLNSTGEPYFSASEYLEEIESKN